MGFFNNDHRDANLNDRAATTCTLTNYRNTGQDCPARFKYAVYGRKPDSRLERGGNNVQRSGTLSANHLSAFSVRCVFVLVWQSQRSAFHHSLQEIWTAHEHYS